MLPPDTAKATAQIAVTRFGGSTGALAYAASGAPAGVTATVTPTGANTAALELTATGLTAPVEGTITVTASGPATAGTGPPLSFPLRVRIDDVRATGIDVSQGVQHITAAGPITGPTSLTQVYDATQNAVLAKGGRTVVRVYGDAPKVPAGACGVTGVVASLSASAGGQELPGSPCHPTRRRAGSVIRTASTPARPAHLPPSTTPPTRRSSPFRPSGRSAARSR